METINHSMHMPGKIKTFQLTASAFDWNISETKTIRAWGFNQSLPGPVIRVNKGDTLVVKFKNELVEPTIIHWHGIRLQASMDGTSHTQRPVMPGETFEYKFLVPDAGTFWYHSHYNETVQMEKGMYGALVVEDSEDIKFDGEKIFMIDDMKLEDDHSFKKGNFLSRWVERHDRRQGDTLLINGKENPTINIAGGHSERWRFINASSARYFYMNMGGRKFTVIGSDGGLMSKPEKVEKLLIVPGERVDIIGGPFVAGETISIESLPYNRRTFVKTKLQKFATIEVGENEYSIVVVPEILRSIEPLAPVNAKINRKVKLSVGASLKHGIDFFVNNALHAQDAPVEVDQLQVWEVANTSLMDHPFHLHGFFFQVLEKNGHPVENIMWKDTVNLPPRSTVKIAWMPDDRPGSWMYHCHILEHHEAGMMGHFEVVGKNERNKSISKHHSHH